MTTDTATWGETYNISAAAQDADGVAVAIDGTWSAALRICHQRTGGTTIFDLDLTIADSAATGSIDTGTAVPGDGVYYYDVRFTDPDGNDYWSESIQLTLAARNTPASS